MRPALLFTATALIVTQAHAQADSAADVFHKVTDSTRTSVQGNDVFRRAAQAKEAAQNRPDVIATDPNQVEAQFVRRDSIAILRRADAVPAAAVPSTPAAATPATPAAPVSPAVAALGAAFTAAGPPDDSRPAVAMAVPKHRTPVANGSIAHKPPPASEHVAPPVEHASVVSSGAAPMPTRMGAVPAPAAPPKAVFNDTLSTLEREAATVSQDVAPRYANEKSTIDSVRHSHNARLDSLEATESGIRDSTERRFEHKLIEAARLKSNAPHTDSTAKHR